MELMRHRLTLLAKSVAMNNDGTLSEIGYVNERDLITLICHGLDYNFDYAQWTVDLALETAQALGGYKGDQFLELAVLLERRATYTGRVF
jgi:hypothetical protein